MGKYSSKIPVGRKQGITPGTLLRVLDGERNGYLKGMLQVLTVAEAELSLARQIGLMDRQNAIAVGDPVIVINDVRELAQGRQQDGSTTKSLKNAPPMRQNQMSKMSSLCNYVKLHR